MSDSGDTHGLHAAEFRRFAATRILLALLLAGALVWGAYQGLQRLPAPAAVTGDERIAETLVFGERPPEEQPAFEIDDTLPAGVDLPGDIDSDRGTHAGQQVTADAGRHPAVPPLPPVPADTAAGHAPEPDATLPPPTATAHAAPAADLPRGVAFVTAAIAPLKYELNERFWGWRPNDLITPTDNVNIFQLGVLEVTRRTAMILAERISRTGTNESFDRRLELAMNWFMVKADKYWFPSAESKYAAGLNEWRRYRGKLEEGQASFYTRADNLIPLLSVYVDLLGSCEESLVKAREKDGRPVSFFTADDYFFYAKGVSSAMVTILEAVAVDFGATIESRHGTEVLHHAIEACHHAIHINPWFITNSDLSGIFANHRANMAAPISHARFYLGVLIKTLST